MRIGLALALLLLPATAQAAIRPVQAEIVVTDVADLKQASLNLNILEGRRTAYRLACETNADELLRCFLLRGSQERLGPRGGFAASQVLCADEAGRSRRFWVDGMLVSLSFSDIVQTERGPKVSGYHFRTTVRPMTLEERRTARADEQDAERRHLGLSCD